MKVDDVFDLVGGWGPFQIYASLLMGLMAFWSYHGVAAPFVVFHVDHWCHVTELANQSESVQRNVAIPRLADGSYDKCYRFALNYSAFSTDDLLHWNRSEHSGADIVPCDSWNYDTSEYHHSAVITYDLVCGREWLVSFASTLYLLGAFMSVFSMGVLSDKFGRVKAVLLANLIVVLGTCVCVTAPNYALFGVGRFLAGFGRLANFCIGVIYILEVVGKKYRTFVGLGYTSYFGLGYCIMPWVAKALKSDIYFQLALTLPTLAYFAFYWLLPETPRWLIVQGKYKEAEKALRRIATFNGRTLDPDFDVTKLEVVTTTSNESKLTALIKHSRLRNRLFVVFFAWFTVILQYFAVALNVNVLPGDIYLATFLLATMDFVGPCLGIGLTSSPRLGRKLTVALSLMMTSLCAFTSLPLMAYDLDTALIIVVMLGRLSLNLALAILYFYTSELFPTEVRNSVVGASSTVGRISGMLGAFVGGPLGTVWWGLPNVIYGVMGLCSGLLCLLLPETLGRKMSDTIEEEIANGQEKKDMEEMDANRNESI